MNNHIKRLMITSVIISLFVLTIFTPPSTSGSIQNPISTPYQINGTELFVENFTTTTYMDPVTTAIGWGDGTVMNDRNETWFFLDSYSTTQPVYDLDVQGRKVYLTGYNPSSSVDSLVALDINDPLNILFCSARNSLTYMTAIAVDGDVAYTGTGTIPSFGTINTYNISDPYLLGGVGVYLDGAGADGMVSDIETNGRLVFYTVYNSSSSRSLRLIDAQDPDSLIEYICDWTTDKALGLDVQNNLAYIAASTEGMYILDVSQKSTVVELSHLPLPGNATEVIVDGGIAYVAAEEFVHTVDISNPADPILLDSYETLVGMGYDLVKQGDTLFVADALDVAILDVADPKNIQEVDLIGPFNRARAVDLYGGVLVIGSNNGILTFQASSVSPTGILDFEYVRSHYPNHFNDLQSWDVRVDDKIAYIAGGPDGFYTLDVSNPYEPEVLDHFEIPSGQIARKLEKSGHFIYCTTTDGLFVFDVSDPSNIVESAFESRIGALDVCVTGDVAFVSLDGTVLSGFVAYNISTPGNAAHMYNVVVGTNITALSVQGPHLYLVDDVLAGFADSFYIYQLLDMAHPIKISTIARYAEHYDICVDGDIAYLASKVWSTIYDVQDPFSPIFKGDINIGSGPIHAMGVWQFGSYTMTAAGDEGVYLIDNPILTPPTGSQYTGVTDALQVTTEGDFTYVAAKDEFVILRHFESPAATFVPLTTLAQSLTINAPFGDGELTTATLFADDFIQGGSEMNYYMSADGGVHWELVVNGLAHSFVDRGIELQWKAEITSLIDACPRIYEVQIEYNYNLRPTLPTINAIEDKFIGTFKASWAASIDDVSVEYEVQVGDSIGFSNILADKTTTKTSATFVVGATGTIYVRVRAIDGEGLTSAWSLTQLNVSFSSLYFGLIIGGVVLIVAIVVTILIFVKKRKNKILER